MSKRTVLRVAACTSLIRSRNARHLRPGKWVEKETPCTRKPRSSCARMSLLTDPASMRPASTSRCISGRASSTSARYSSTTHGSDDLLCGARSVAPGWTDEASRGVTSAAIRATRIIIPSAASSLSPPRFLARNRAIDTSASVLARHTGSTHRTFRALYRNSKYTGSLALGAIARKLLSHVCASRHHRPAASASRNGSGSSVNVIAGIPEYPRAGTSYVYCGTPGISPNDASTAVRSVATSSAHHSTPEYAYAAASMMILMFLSLYVGRCAASARRPLRFISFSASTASRGSSITPPRSHRMQLYVHVPPR